MNSTTTILIWAAVIGVVFVFLWKKGLLLRLSDYVAETREELRKCTWPTVEELKGSTVVVTVSIVLLGGFTIAVDLVISQLIHSVMW